MFSYYGSKSKIVKFYPIPKEDTIVEPFAGSARYALEHWEHSVILTDTFEKVYRVWKYLQAASSKDILALPDIPPSTPLRDAKGFSQICEEAKWLIGFCSNRGSAIPKNVAGKFSNWERDRCRIAKELYKIRHWDIRLGSYADLPNVRATWFIDPPYQQQGKWYSSGNANSISYSNLSFWVQERRGQVIVCENEGADWLPFEHLANLYSQLHSTKEVIWYKETV